MVCCGVSLIVRSDPNDFANREYLNNYLMVNYSAISRDVVTRNISSTSVTSIKLLVKNLSVHVSDKPMSRERSSSEVVSSDVTMKSDDDNTVMPTSSSGPVRVEEIKNLYDTDLVLSHGIKLQWIRNRMMA